MARNYLGGVLPVGSVIHSMLTTAQFQSEMGSNWVLADGSSCTGTKYASITGAANLPDMRGVFLRGKNNGSSRNPNGDLALGAYTADKYISHNHSIIGYDALASSYTAVDRPMIINGPEFNVIQNNGATESSGGNETAPKSITVNIFIRIN